jgi:hypothetical protein
MTKWQFFHRWHSPLFPDHLLGPSFENDIGGRDVINTLAELAYETTNTGDDWMREKLSKFPISSDNTVYC